MTKFPNHQNPTLNNKHDYAMYDYRPIFTTPGPVPADKKPFLLIKVEADLISQQHIGKNARPQTPARPTTPCSAKACQSATTAPTVMPAQAKPNHMWQQGISPFFCSRREQKIIQKPVGMLSFLPSPRPLMPKVQAPKSSANHFYVCNDPCTTHCLAWRLQKLHSQPQTNETDEK